MKVKQIKISAEDFNITGMTRDQLRAAAFQFAELSKVFQALAYAHNANVQGAVAQRDTHHAVAVEIMEGLTEYECVTFETTPK